MKRLLTRLSSVFSMIVVCLGLVLSTMRPVQAYPAYAQAAYDNPREATGKIVCANCHLAQMPTLVEVPQAVTPGQVFNLKVKIPYDHSLQEVYSDGSLGGLGVGAVVVLPEGFRLATEEEMSEQQREETAETYISEYSDTKPNILVVGPIPGDEHPEILFPIKAPDPAEDPSVHFLKYSIHVGANRGRGQLNPDGSLSNNNQFRSPYSGLVTEITTLEDPSTVSPDLPYATLVNEESMPGTRIVTISTESGSRLATEEEMSEQQREETAETYISEYSDTKPNILVVGPIPGDEHPEILFPIKAPDPAEDPSVHFLKYSIHVGANRGRGQLNPDGSLSNNNQFRSPYSGLVTEITTLEDPSTVSPDLPYATLVNEESMPGTRIVTISTESGSQYVAIPPGPQLTIAVGSSVKADAPLTNNPNVGGFGQVDREIVLQSPTRIKWLLAFLGAIFFAQLMLVLKKKQVEQLQAAEALGL